MQKEKNQMEGRGGQNAPPTSALTCKIVPSQDSLPAIHTDGPAMINAVDLFAGAGGLSLAAYNVGINILAAVEICKDACLTYRKNLIERLGLNINLFDQDINVLTPGEMIAKVPALAEKCDLLMGGPPCQGFSSHRIKNKGVGDPRNELLIRYFHFVRAFQPTAFLVENVPGLLWERHRDYLKRFRLEAIDAGYRIYDPIVLNASDYGVPQRRKRVFILGVKAGIHLELKWPPESTHCKFENNLKGNSKKPEWGTAAEIFKNPLSENDPNAVHMNHSPEMIRRFQNTPINGGSRRESGHILPCHKNHDGHKDCYGRINPSKGRFVHPTEHHGISLRHAARFQTFPDNFVFQGGLIAGGVQIGNAVPVIMGEQLLAQLAGSISKIKENLDG